MAALAVNRVMSFSIRSVSSDSELMFKAHESSSHFVVELRQRDLIVTREVYCYPGDPTPWVLFSDLAAQSKPWQEPKVWESLEGELRIEAKSDSTGHIYLGVMFSKHEGEEPWRVQSMLLTEFGQLPTIAANAKVFVHENR
jgi:hypothetical protein